MGCAGSKQMKNIEDEPAHDEQETNDSVNNEQPTHSTNHNNLGDIEEEEEEEEVDDRGKAGYNNNNRNEEREEQDSEIEYDGDRLVEQHVEDIEYEENEYQKTERSMESQNTKKSTDANEWRYYHDDLKKKLLLERIRDATALRHRKRLETTLEESVDFDDLSEHKDIKKATKVLIIIIARDALRAAIDSEVIEDINNEIDSIKQNGYYKQLQQEVIEANHMIIKIERRKRSQDGVLAMNRKTMSEIRRYHNPPQMMHRIIQAALLLLGEDEITTSEWPYCQKILNPQNSNVKDGMSNKVLDFKAGEVHPQIWSRSKEILVEELYDKRTGKPVEIPVPSKNKLMTRKQREEEVEKYEENRKYYDTYNMEAIKKVSPAAATFYIWAMGIIDDCEKIYYNNDENSEDPEPANEQKQLEIFHRTHLHKNHPKNSPPPKYRKMKRESSKYLQRSDWHLEDEDVEYAEGYTEESEQNSQTPVDAY